MESEKAPSNNCVLVVDNGEETDLVQLTYDITWENLSVMLQIKYHYEEMPVFTYCDEEEDYITLDSQEALEEAQKVCRKDDDVLHIQMRKFGSQPFLPVKKVSAGSGPSSLSTSAKENLESVRTTIYTKLEQASNLVRTTVRGFGRNKANEEVVSMEGISLEQENLIPSDNVEGDEGEQVGTSLEPALTDSNTQCNEIIGSGTNEESSSRRDVNEEDDVVEQDNEIINLDGVVKTIKEEVRKAVTEELSTFRNEISGHLENFYTRKDLESGESESKASKLLTGSNLPEIAAPTEELRNEAKVEKEVKRLKQRKCDSSNNGVDSPIKKPRKYAARFICENLLDGTYVESGQQFVKYWVLMNDGKLPWDNSIQLELLEEHPSSKDSHEDSFESSSDEETRSTSVAARKPLWGPKRKKASLSTTNHGETAVVAVHHIAPSYPCVYKSTWQLSHYGYFFGPRIRCNVVVVRKEDRPSMTSSTSYDASESEQEYSLISERIASQKVSLIGLHDTSNHPSIASNNTFVGEEGDETKKSGNILKGNEDVTDSGAPSSPLVSVTHVAAEDGEASQHQDEDHDDHTSQMGGKEDKDEQLCGAVETEAHSDFESIDVATESNMPTFTKICANQLDVENENKVSTNKADAEEVEDEDAMNVSVLDKEDDASSDLSDFEVIPIPECFDISRPLGTDTRNDEEQQGTSASPPTTSAVSAGYDVTVIAMDADTLMEDENPEVEEVSEEVPIDAEDAGSEGEDADSVAVEEEHIDEMEENLDQQLPNKLLTGTSLSTNLVKVPQKQQMAISSPSPIPQSVLDMDKPCEVQSYDQGYSLPTQKVAKEETWDQKVLPLPRGVLNADKPWKKQKADGSSSSSHPQRPSLEIKASSKQKAWDAESVTSPSAPPKEQVQFPDDDTPEIYYPPERESGDESQPEEEFTLALDNTTDPHSPTEVLVPPGYPQAQLPGVVSNNQVLPTQEPDNLSPMEQLIEMGFMDIDLNHELLNQYQDDVNRAVSILITRETNRATEPQNRRQDGSFLA